MTDEQREREMRESADMATRWPNAPYATRYAEDVPWLLARLDEARRERDGECMMTDAERCLREWAEQRAGPGTTHWDGCYESHPACAARAVLRELDALRDAAREDLAFLDAVRRENERLRAELDDARWLIEDLQLDLRALAKRVDTGRTEG